MKRILGNILTFFLIPAVLAGVFFTWSLPRITSDYNFNTDELIYIERSKYWEAFKAGDFNNPIWSEWGAYDQPQLTNYVYAQVPGDKSLVETENSPCKEKDTSFYMAWGCLDGPPINTWPKELSPLTKLVTKTRTLATAISAVAIAMVYYLGVVISGPITGVLAALYLGWFSYFKNLSTMVMMDQILLVFIVLQTIIGLRLLKSQKPNLSTLLMLGIVSGFAVSTKLSAFIPTAILFALSGIKTLRNRKLNITQWVASVVCAMGIFISLHPSLWRDPVNGITQMITWRTTQINNQSVNKETIPANLQEKFTFTVSEAFTSWNSNANNSTLLPLGVIAALALIHTLRSSPQFTLMAALNIAAFILLIPIKWNRYLLPIMPFIAVLVGHGVRYILPAVGKNLKLLTGIALAITVGIGVILKLGAILSATEVFIIVLSTILATQGAIVTRAMLYGFTHPAKKVDIDTKKKHKRSFSLILPVRQEDRVIGDTLSAFNKINYPKNLYEVLIPVRPDDYATINAINKALEENPDLPAKTILVDGDATTKSYSLNVALHYATKDTVGVFDAEDEPHPDLLKRIEYEFEKHPEYAAVQAPVQLINLNSSWYSALNSLEYYFWFQSVLPFLTRQGLTPLGGNTIFTKRNVLKELGGWDETCLTEDADMGVRLGAKNLSVGIVTDYRLATLEETPSDEIGVIKQRSRWDQGYLQVLGKGQWRSLSVKQQMLAVYTLTQPIFRHLAFVNMFIAPILGSFLHVSIGVALISFLPTYFLILQWGMYILGLRDISEKYGVKVNAFRYVITILFFYPYQALLSLATFRAIGKAIIGNKTWDKTAHYNTHRPNLATAA